MSVALRRSLCALQRSVTKLRGAPSAGSTDVIGVLAALEAAVERQPLCQRTRADWWTTQPTFFSALAQPDPEPGAEQHSAAQAGSEIRLTDSAIERIRQLTGKEGKGSFLRVTVEAGGCSGFSYKFELDTDRRESDRIFEAGGVRLVVDPMSFEFIRGASVDYSQELIKSAFEVVDNPNADKGCGCGTSFSPK